MKNFFTVIVIVLSLKLGAQNYIEHKVLEGETIEGIAKKYLVTPFDIFALNPDAKSDFKVNTVLIIPNSKVKNKPIEEASRELIGYKKHKVKRKETLYGLSKKYGVSEEEIKKANRFLYSENLKKGDKIKIPQYKTFVSKQTYKNTVKKYTVLPSEGKWRVAYKFGITVAELEALNPNMKPMLQPGDLLNVPNLKDEDEKPIDAEYSYYEVLPKEGFYRLKVKTGLTQEQLEALNPELKESGLKAGMVLKIPASENAVSDSLPQVETTTLASKIKNYEVKKIALMMPYQLHRIDVDSVEDAKDMIKNKKLLSLVLDFHVGVKMALDSAKQLGISTHLKVLDTRYQASTTAKLLLDNDLSSYDAVIGPMQEQSFDHVAKVLNRHRVPVIAALNKPKEVYNNVFQTIPDDKLLQKAILDFVKNDSLKSKVIVIADAASKKKVDILKKAFPNILVKNARKDKKGLPFFYPTDLNNMVSPGKTYVFLETKSNAFASSVTSMLNGFVKPNTQIILTTLDKGKEFEGKDISNNYLSNLQFHYPFIKKDFDTSKNNGFVKAYKKEFGVTPNKYAVRGFDIALDILLRLATQGNLYDASNAGVETEYVENKFRYKETLLGGYTNEAVYVVKYDNLRIVEAN